MDRLRERHGSLPGELFNGHWYFWLSAIQRFERASTPRDAKGRDNTKYLPRNRVETVAS